MKYGVLRLSPDDHEPGNRPMNGVTVRVCALCGRPEGRGKPPTSPQSLRVKWALEKGIPLKQPMSSFLHLRCDRRLMWLIDQAIKRGEAK